MTWPDHGNKNKCVCGGWLESGTLEILTECVFSLSVFALIGTYKTFARQYSDTWYGFSLVDVLIIPNWRKRKQFLCILEYRLVAYFFNDLLIKLTAQGALCRSGFSVNQLVKMPDWVSPYKL